MGPRTAVTALGGKATGQESRQAKGESQCDKENGGVRKNEGNPRSQQRWARIQDGMGPL